jgi:hypothetical protein
MSRHRGALYCETVMHCEQGDCLSLAPQHPFRRRISYESESANTGGQNRRSNESGQCNFNFRAMTALFVGMLISNAIS